MNRETGIDVYSLQIKQKTIENLLNSTENSTYCSRVT